MMRVCLRVSVSVVAFIVAGVLTFPSSSLRGSVWGSWCPLRSRVDDSSGSAATSGLRSEHLRQLLVLEAALQELVLRQLPVIVLVHLREYVLRSLLRAVRRPVARTRAEHVVYRLGTEGQQLCFSAWYSASRRINRLRI